MDPKTASRLIEINRQFYEDFSKEFSATRQRLQPGVQRILSSLGGSDRILDLGCGNGELAAALLNQGFRGSYLGLDFSLGLLAEARSSSPHPSGQARISFLQSELTSPGWAADLPAQEFDAILAFAVLHHIPGEENRLEILQSIHTLLVPGGRFLLSVWQFPNSPRWSSRILPWETVGLQPDRLDPGDALLDWRSGGRGLRYVHAYSAVELENLAATTGFQVQETFSSDGREGNLGLYQEWVKRDAHP